MTALARRLSTDQGERVGEWEHRSYEARTAVNRFFDEAKLNLRFPEKSTCSTESAENGHSSTTASARKVHFVTRNRYCVDLENTHLNLTAYAINGNPTQQMLDPD
jgi:hypothetical protein